MLWQQGPLEMLVSAVIWLWMPHVVQAAFSCINTLKAILNDLFEWNMREEKEHFILGKIVQANARIPVCRPQQCSEQCPWKHPWIPWFQLTPGDKNLREKNLHQLMKNLREKTLLSSSTYLYQKCHIRWIGYLTLNDINSAIKSALKISRNIFQLKRLIWIKEALDLNQFKAAGLEIVKWSRSLSKIRLKYVRPTLN